MALSPGTDKRDGFSVLSELDSNKDGKIDATDAEFNKLRIWVDANSNGVAEADELKSLSDTGIKSISLDATPVSLELAGNPVSHISTVSMTDGSTRPVWDVWFQHSDEVTRVVTPDGFVFSEEALKLPLLMGFGQTGDLRYEMTLDTFLAVRRGGAADDTLSASTG